MANPQLEQARRLIEDTGVNLFLTGKAGTGKTTFLRHFRDTTAKRVVVTAPTGIAAINAGGVTLHSFFQLSFSPFVPGYQREENKRYDRFSREKLRVIRTMDVLVIDEMSMVRADLLDAVDASLRRHRDPTRPFGGVQLLMIGDLQQLPPVIRDDEAQLLRQYYPSSYFFESHALRDAGYETVELTQVYRQKEGVFLDVLNRIRTNTADQKVLDVLNSRCQPGFNPSEEEGYIRLTTHNRLADAINNRELKRLHTPQFTFEAQVEGDFPETSFPAERYLTIKEGAQVMFIKNDSQGHRYYNGMIGHVSSISSEGIEVSPSDGSAAIDVQPEEWENNKYTIDPQTNAISEEVTGSFSQYPLRLAWGITIHKSQGLTFDRAIIDAAAAFAHGQTYVALSRCRSLEGLVLERPLTTSAVINDSLVTEYVADCARRSPDEQRMAQLQQAYTLSLVGELFGMRRLRMAYESMMRSVDEALSRAFPALAGEWHGTETVLRQADEVAQRFLMQCRGIMETPQPDRQYLNQRINAGAQYFKGIVEKVAGLLKQTPTTHDNTEHRLRLNQRKGELHELVQVKLGLLTAFTSAEFSPSVYLQLKANAVLAVEGKSPAVAKRTPKRVVENTVAAEEYIPDEVNNKELYLKLVEWKAAKVRETGLNPSRIISNPALVRIANAAPSTLRQLAAVKGFGGKKLDEYGEELMAVCAPYAQQGSLEGDFDEKQYSKKKKTLTWEVSLEMFEQGATINEIAAERNLTESTVESHLMKAFLADRIGINRLVSPEDMGIIMAAIKEKKEEDTMKAVYEALEGRYSYMQLRAVAHWMKK